VARDVCFSTSLDTLIKRTPGCNQQAVADALGVSSATVSRYLSGSQNPTFDNLIALADYFNVSLDRIAFGGSSAPDYAPVMRYIERFMLQARDAQQHATWRTAQVARKTAETVERAVVQALENVPEAEDEISLPPGVLHMTDIMLLERYSLETSIWWPVLIPSGPTIEFTNITAENLAAGNRYRYLISAMSDPTDRIQQWRSSLSDHLSKNGNQNALQQFEIRITDQPAPAEIALYRLNTRELEREQPHLVDLIRPFIHNNHAGEICDPSYTTFWHAFMDRPRFDQAQASFQHTWNTAQPV